MLLDLLDLEQFVWSDELHLKKNINLFEIFIFDISLKF